MSATPHDPTSAVQVVPVEPLLVDTDTARRMLGDISLSTINRARLNGDIEAVKIGRAVRYTVESIHAYVDSLRGAA